MQSPGSAAPRGQNTLKPADVRSGRKTQLDQEEQSVETNPEMTDGKVTHKPKTTHKCSLGFKVMNTVRESVWTLTREMETVKEQIPEVKNVGSEVNNSPDGPRSR